jgi:hypothetical protein
MSHSLTYIEIDVPTFTVQSPESTQTFRFAIPTSYLPGDIDCIPSIDNVSFTPARISLGEDLGQRASLRVTLRDHLHIFAGEPYAQGTFWGKWRGRYGTKLRGRPLRLIRGVVGQTIAQMETRYYVIEATDGPTTDGVYTIEAKDVLKYADDDRAQAPVVSNGKLAGSLDSVITTAILSPTGIGNTEYPASGYVCIGGSEVVAFTRVSDTLTITRGQFGSVAQEHNSGDRVQIVLRYPGSDVADIVRDLLVNYAGVPDEFISLADWQAETSAYLGVIYAATITEPTAVRTLLSELVQQAALAIWWDDRAQRVRLNVLREIATDTDSFNEDRIIEGSLSVQEQPNKRISQIWTFYGQRDPTNRNGGEDNYRAALADVDLARETEYGSAAVTKITARWVETLTAATRLNNLQLSRFRDPPRAFAFDLIHGETVTPVAGYRLGWWGSQDSAGNLVDVPIQVTQVSIFSDRIHIEAEEMLASGVVVLVHTVLLTDYGAVRSWTVPATWNDSDNIIECIGGGAGGRRAGNSGGESGGGAGAYAAKNNVNLTPGGTESYRIGSAGVGGVGTGQATSGTDTFFGAAIFASSIVGAKAGTAGSSRTSPGVGGQAAACIGDVKFSGGNGGTGAPRSEAVQDAGGGGGGGAAGPHGAGADGGSGTSTTQNGGAGGGGADGGFSGAVCVGGTGGDGGDNRFSFGGGNSSTPAGDEGGGGRGSDAVLAVAGGVGGDGEQIWTQTVTPIFSAGPGGGGGAGGAASPGYPGGFYGGAGGGGGNLGAGGDGGPGLIAISWREA